MTAKEIWLNESLILVEWNAPLTYQELDAGFQRLAEKIACLDQPVDVVFDISASGHIPVEAPILATRSGFLHLPQTRNVLVIGLNDWAQILARFATRASGKPITFYATYEDAVQALTHQNLVPE